MNFAAPKRIPTKPRKDMESSARIGIIEQDIGDMKVDIEECKDIKNKMATLEERAAELMIKARENRNAIFGTNGSPGVLSRLSNVESNTSDMKKIMWTVLIGVIGVIIEQIIQLVLTHGPQLVK